MTTVSHGKPYAGNPHVRFEEGASESAKPSRKALLHRQLGFRDGVLCSWRVSRAVLERPPPLVGARARCPRPR